VESYRGVMPASTLRIIDKRSIEKEGLTRLKGGRVGATRTYARGEGSGGVSSQEGTSQPSLKRESPCGSSGWDYTPYQKLRP